MLVMVHLAVRHSDRSMTAGRSTDDRSRDGDRRPDGVVRWPATAADESVTEAGSLAPAVARAALILDSSRRMAGIPWDRASWHADSAFRNRRSRTSAAPWPMPAGSTRRDGLRARPSPGRTRGRVPRHRRPGPGVLRSVATPAGASEETVQFAVLDGLEVTYLARHDGGQPVQLASGIGRRRRRIDGDGQGRARITPRG